MSKQKKKKQKKQKKQSKQPKQYEPRLKKEYRETIVPKLKKELNYENVMEVPKLVKMTINRGVGKAVANEKILDRRLEELTLITGQKAVPTKARKAVSGFKVNKGVAVGAKVTLRSNRMYEFLDRLVAVSLPRMRDFDGIEAKGFDGGGNFTLGLEEQIIFPEIDIDEVDEVTGMDITFVTTANTDQEAFYLLKELGLPFKQQKLN
jgi:large subunit ribosomal protein L5